MTAKIAIVANQKGGSGKTNLAVHMSGTAIRRGYKTLLIDADPQGTATIWVSNAEEGTKHKIRVMGLAATREKIAQEVKQFVEDYDIIIVDCPPAVDSKIPQVMLMIADLALVPIIPNPGDVWAAAPLLELADQAKVINPDLETRLVGSRVQANLAMHKQGLKTMSEMHQSAPLLKTSIAQRVSYVESMLAGDSAHYFGGSAKPAIKELESLFDEVVGVLRLSKVKKS